MTNNPTLLHDRIHYLQSQLQEEGIFAALIQKPRNLYYYAQTSQPSNLWVPAEGEPILFTRRAHEFTREQTHIKNVINAGNLKEMKAYLIGLDMFPSFNHYIGAEIDFLPYNLVKKLESTIDTGKLINITNIIMEQRLVKSDDEVQKIRNSAKLWKLSHEAILEHGRAGQKEHEIAAIFESEARKNGGDGLVWFHRWDACLPGGGIVASGENSWVISGHAMTVTGVGLSNALPWGSSNRHLKNGDLMVLDYGISKEGYHSDMARTYSIGKASIKQIDLWNKLLDVHFQVIDKVRPGISGAELYEFALNLVKQRNMEEFFMGIGDNRGEYIGHSIGLELDEFPVIGPKAKEPFKENTVITLEPKFMVPEIGSVMVEDDILITPNGHEIIGEVGHELFEIN
ncbi:Xaa-Pro peptidase family protein [Bacillus sp. JJ1533]|uniref:M24 family metallopeptidase n=1 Tax=Bacillus sp. JJ1533 TaxID=3122959 RepID=UPI002FFEE325